ncbi:Androglobin [Dissostichus eleginoides]|uniref:Androglobin n=1 Tax=Dissostichus eleginoides TaxID=100907 RepID=A0AAD9B8U5_DISEL|nr:Androglobin [Dissostichus eleginoides]
MQAQTLFHQDLFHSFEAMKTAAPGMSRQAFTAMLDQRTKQFGRTGKEGAGTTLGEEVEQVNSFLSRCALTTKYMAKSVRTDMLTVHAMGWNHRKENGLHIALSSRFKKTAEKTEAVTESLKKMQDQLNCSDDMLELWVDDKQWASKGSASASPADAGCLQISIEALFVSICQKKHYLYRQNDRNKRRQKIVQKIAQENKRLLEDIHKYNQQPDGDPIDTNKVVEKLSTKSAESMIWPWQEPNRDGVDILTKKGLFDKKMLLSRLTEEKQILVKEMMQHCQYLKDSVSKVQTLMAPVSLITQTGSYPNGITEEGYKGLMCLLRRNLHDLRLKQQTVAGAYRGILEPSLVEEEDEDREVEKDWQSDNSSDDEDDAEEGT